MKKSCVWFIGLSNGAGGFTYTRGNWDPNWQVFVASLDSAPGDDLFLYNQRTGTWVKALTLSSGNAFNYISGTWAAGRDVRIVDLDRNGRDDVFTYDRITGA